MGKSIRKLILGLILSIVVIIIGVLYYIASPGYIERKYEKAFNSKDCNQIYDLIYIEDGDFLTKDVFVRQCSININSLKLDISLKRTNYKKHLIINNYRIENKIVKVISNVNLMIPNNVTIYLENNSINKYYSNNDDYNSLYIVDRMFESAYNIKINNGEELINTSFTPTLEEKYFTFEFDD